MQLYVEGKKVKLDPRRAIGKGGEADVYDIGGGLALKVFKSPDHPDYAGLPQEQLAAAERIAQHQRKLPAFPSGLPARVVAPQKLARRAPGGEIVGYTMRRLTGCQVLFEYGTLAFRDQGVAPGVVLLLLQDLLRSVGGVHRAGLVIGDFNDLNVLVSVAEAHLIDADSFQYGPFQCRMYTHRFLDPLRCDPSSGTLLPRRPPDPDSDWYAFTIMVMQCLLYVGPYGGVYRPKDPARQVPQEARPLRRITVFHPEVRYPKPALPYGALPDDLLHHFHLVFEKDRRGAFPDALLSGVRWTRCSACGREHARAVCPFCRPAPEAAVKTVTRVRGRVTATRVFATRGVILFAAMQGGQLRFLYHEDGSYRREDGSAILTGELDPRLRVRLRGASTLLGKDGLLVTLSPHHPPDRLAVGSYGTRPVFDANTRSRYWIDQGLLLRDGRFGAECVGGVLEGQTLFWAGPEFGFGLYRAGNLSVAFVFDAHGGGMNDRVALPPFRGPLVDATCVFTPERCWFLAATEEGGRLIHRCLLVTPQGAVEASASGERDDGSWLGRLGGKCAAGNLLLVPTDEGILRVEPDGPRLVKTREFPDTEAFVDAGCRLLAAEQGLYVVDRREIRLIRLNG